MNENVIRYRKSRIGQVQERIKLAKLSGKPIVYLQTMELEFVKKLLEMRSIFPDRYPSKDSDNVISKSSILYQLPRFALTEDGISDSGITQPSLFLLFVDETIEKQNAGIQLINEQLFSFIQLYKTVSLQRTGQGTSVSKNVTESLILIITSQTPSIPSSIAPYSEYIRLEPIMGEELDEVVSDILYKESNGGVELEKTINGFKRLKDTEYLHSLTKQVKGLSETKIKQIFSQIKVSFERVYWEKQERGEVIAGKILQVIRKEKEQLIAMSSILKLEKSSGKKASGLENLEAYLKSKCPIVKDIDKHKQERMLEAPKGVLMAGIPGSGKSLMAKYTAHLLGLPLIRMDMGDVQNKYVGESERRMEEALNLVNAMSPCVLWVDEIEKSLAGSQRGEGSSDVVTRLFGKFLNWLQEKEEKNVCCFVFATANDVSSLPSELFRSGRFDAKYYTYMPTAEECGEIFESLIEYQNHVYKEGLERNNTRNQRRLFDEDINRKLFVKYLNSPICIRRNITPDSNEIYRGNKFFTGADIDNAIKRAKELYFLKNYSITGKFVYTLSEFKGCLEEAIDDMKTYGETDLEKIASCYANMASNNFMAASQGNLMPNEGYNEYRMDKNNPQKHILYQLENENRHVENMTHPYDQCLYSVVRNVLNNNADNILYQKNRQR